MESVDLKNLKMYENVGCNHESYGLNKQRYWFYMILSQNTGWQLKLENTVIWWGFLKLGVPQTMGFAIKQDPFRMILGPPRNPYVYIFK